VRPNIHSASLFHAKVGEGKDWPNENDANWPALLGAYCFGIGNLQGMEASIGRNGKKSRENMRKNGFYLKENNGLENWPMDLYLFESNDHIFNH
jgi:hypothetical protein